MCREASSSRQTCFAWVIEAYDGLAAIVANLILPAKKQKQKKNSIIDRQFQCLIYIRKQAF